MRRAAILVLAGLGLAMLPLSAAAGGGCHSKASMSATTSLGSDAAAVPIEKCAFSPTVLYIDPGTTVTWTNHDPVPHTVTGALFAFGNDQELLDQDSLSYRFEEEGVYPYACILHPGMNGAVVVGDGKSNEFASGMSGGITQVFEDEGTAETETTGESESTAAVADTDEAFSGPAVIAIALGVAALFFGLGLVTRQRRSAPARPRLSAGPSTAPERSSPAP